MRTLKTNLLALLVICTACTGGNQQKNTEQSAQKVIVAYVTSRDAELPDPAFMTHINYAFGHVNESFDGVRISNEERLKQIVALKQKAPRLKVMLSIGGWGSGRFSEMAASDENRQKFARDCQRVVSTFGLDGIDIDWEYPTRSSAGISSSPDDTHNYTLLMRDIRQAIGTEKLLTQATVASAKYMDFKAIDRYIDFTNIMSYDMGNAPQHHAALFRSQHAGRITAEEAVKAHLEAGVPKHKLVMGMPFYGRGKEELLTAMDYKEAELLTDYNRQWDDTAKVPYLTDKEGVFVFGYDNPRSLAIKCQYILDQGLLGAMYWEYSCDNQAGDLRRTVYEGIFKP